MGPFPCCCGVLSKIGATYSARQYFYITSIKVLLPLYWFVSASSVNRSHRTLLLIPGAHTLESVRWTGEKNVW